MEINKELPLRPYIHSITSSVLTGNNLTKSVNKKRNYSELQQRLYIKDCSIHGYRVLRFPCDVTKFSLDSPP